MANPAQISWLKYGWETTFGTASTSLDKTFGNGKKLTGLKRKNNILRLYDMGYRNAQVLVPLKFEGAASMEFALCNPWIFKAILGAPTTTGAGPYTHTFAESDTLTSFTIENDVKTDTAHVSKLLGCIAGQTTLSMVLGEIVRVKMDMPFANETASASTSANVAETFTPMTFANGTLEMPNGSSIAGIQNLDLTIDQKPNPQWDGGSRFAQLCPLLNREYTFRASLSMRASATMLEKLYGGSSGPVAAPAETATLELTFDNGLTGTNQRNIVALLTGVQFDEHNLPQDPEATIIEDATMFARSMQVTAVNNTATCP